MVGSWGDGDVAELFRDRLHGGPPIDRWIGLEYLAATGRTGDVDRRGDLTVDDVMVCHGDLEVEGNLQVRGVLVVLGDLTVGKAAVLFGGDYPCLFVGGEIRCRDFFANSAETVCLGELAATRAVVLVYNHTVTVARSVRADLLVTDDAGIDGEIHAARRSQGRHADYREHFGLELDDSDPDFDSQESIYEPLIERLRS